MSSPKKPRQNLNNGLEQKGLKDWKQWRETVAVNECSHLLRQSVSRVTTLCATKPDRNLPRKTDEELLAFIAEMLPFPTDL